MTLPEERSNLKGGKYTIEKKYGEGAFGIIYRAKDNVSNMTVAIKTLNPEVSKKQYEANLERFKREKQILSELSHPHIVHYYDAFEENQIPYLVMQFLTGKDLRELLKEEGQLEYRVAFDYIYQIGLALKYLHNKGDHNLQHRDVQPKNIMIEEIQLKNKVKTKAFLIDFGIVQHRELITELHPSISNFTHYKQREDNVFDQRLDVYSLAACLYFALTNEIPTDSEERQRRLVRKEQDLKPLSVFNPKIKKNVERAIMKGMTLNEKKIPSMEVWLNMLPKPLHWYWQELTKVGRVTVLRVKYLNRFLRRISSVRG